MSDPGYQLIKEALNKNIRVIPVPGPCAFVAALSVSGIPTDSFVFVGFAARKKTKRLKELEQLADEKRTIVFYESPRRIKALIGEIILNIGDRKGVLCREMTKMHEEFIKGNLSDIIRSLEERPSVKGECTLIVERDEKTGKISMDELRKEIQENLTKSTKGLSDFAKAMAKKYDLPRNIIYEEAVKIKDSGFATCDSSKASDSKGQNKFLKRNIRP
jgi:16S rRNA (cytidine1402-2'-O)-methyltransferase